MVVGVLNDIYLEALKRMSNLRSQVEEVVNTEEENKEFLTEIKEHIKQEPESEAEEEYTVPQKDIKRSTDDLELDFFHIPAEGLADIKAEIKQEKEINEPGSILSSLDYPNEDYKITYDTTMYENIKKELTDWEETVPLVNKEDSWSGKQEETTTWEESAPHAEIKIQVPSTTTKNGMQATTSWRTPVLISLDTAKPTSCRTPVPLAQDIAKPTTSNQTPVPPAQDTTKPTTSWQTPVSPAQDTANPTTSWKTPVPPAQDTAKPTTSWRTPVPPAGPTPAKQPRKANVQTKNNNGKPMQQNQSKPVDSSSTTPAKEPVTLKSTIKCDPHRDVPTPEEKATYQYTALERLRSFQRPGSSVVILKRFTSNLESYVGVLKYLDHRFLHSPAIMRVVCGKLEPYIMSSWCDYAAQHHKVGKPLILTMLDFLNHKVEIGFRYWYPFTKDGMLASRKRKYPDSSN